MNSIQFIAWLSLCVGFQDVSQNSAEAFSSLNRQKVLGRTRRPNNRFHPTSLGSSFDEEGESTRRSFLSNAFLISVIGSTLSGSDNKANAFEKTFPSDLEVIDGLDLEQLKKKKIKQERERTESIKRELEAEPFIFRNGKDILGSISWGFALWLLAGSRSNPLVKPIGNVLYDPEEDQWLKDRNDGLFSPLPLQFTIQLGCLFVFFGVLADRVLLLLADGDSSVILQLAGVAIIGAATLELGRLASGEKRLTRDDADQMIQLMNEFDEFAASRIIPGGNCHRSEIVKAFRRYYAKYRQADSTEYPLSDLEIERLLRNWNLRMGNEDMSSAGFFVGIQINSKADAFR
mmetsp:Transcript_13328/g.20219  ORF Transcript_13328/g.20219 Transcript_13328/m.20219 type:complete len:346 (-) Transcript_13328:426-1463(-)